MFLSARIVWYAPIAIAQAPQPPRVSPSERTSRVIAPPRRGIHDESIGQLARHYWQLHGDDRTAAYPVVEIRRVCAETGLNLVGGAALERSADIAPHAAPPGA
jgi:hypothetical protein